MALLVVGMTSCKYDEGPFISFIPKTERVANTWVPNEAEKNGVSSTTLPGFKEITFFKEGGCTLIQNPTGFDVASSGTWAFSDDKLQLLIDLDDELTQQVKYQKTWTILHLKEDELKVSFSDTSGSYVVTFEPGL